MAGSFSVHHLDYGLPESLIAQEPAAERGTSRLLVLDRHTGVLQDRMIAELPAFLRPGDALVVNDTRVVPARFQLRRATGGRIEGLFLYELSGGLWEVLLKGAGRLQPGERVRLEGAEAQIPATVVERGQRGAWRLQLESAEPAPVVLASVGRMPLPPYIGRERGADVRDERDRTWYQTVYAARDGAVAAPTAGLHFTPQLLDQIRACSVRIVPVTLHVGYGTFAPIEEEDLAAHVMHAEHYEVSAEAAATLRAAQRDGGRIFAVGTTSARTLETAWERTRFELASSGSTQLFCYPGHRFECVDALLTNFHLPRSTLLAMVMAFAGVELIRGAYAHAIEKRYRFFSYGDAMLIV